MAATNAKLTRKQVYPAAYFFCRMILKAEENEIMEALDRGVVETWQIEELASLGRSWANKGAWPEVWAVVMEY